MRVKNLSVFDGKKVLVDALSFTLKEGEITALIGKSGSGKSLSAMALLELTPVNLRSELSLEGDVKFALIMQNPRTAFNQIVSIKTHCLESIKASGVKKNLDDVVKILADVGLGADTLDRYAFELSGGQLQRVMIAIALVCEAKFIIADEPTTSLDLLVQAKILELLSELVKRKNIGILLITHDFSVVAKLADDVIVMSEGRIVEQAKSSEIFTKPKHNATKELLEAHFALYKDSL
ncbi:ATP-binding cassette domain-containing protein [Campylobacter suis]|uniref:Nickel import ATP-binding protein NikD n=1 Tax=Campylobacter suis TaxID=2790657 RepID=A0ABN7K4U6_9BACT|nr:ATP-binding cassette domain-containing protein [Campylobacter suis]CAD7286949.1 Nickel import ATP-binding protein NikD [Campylobacter suis]